MSNSKFASVAPACPLLTSHPNNLVIWGQKAQALIATEHGNSCVRYMQTGFAPLYVRMPEYLYGDEDADAVDNDDYDTVSFAEVEIEDWKRDNPPPRLRDDLIAYEAYKKKVQRWDKKRQAWLDAQERIFPRIASLISEESMRHILHLHKKE